MNFETPSGATGRALFGLLENASPASIAIAGRDGVAISYGELSELVERFAGQLAGAGIKRTDRVAIAVQNGPLAALGFLGTATAAVCAPLNPNYTQPEFEFALGDLPAAALVTDGSVPAAAAAASGMDVPVFVCGRDFGLEKLPPGEADPADAGDVALILHTSGTTGRPKRVPLTHANLVISASNIASCLALTPGDRCLNVMPLFHIHGLVGGLLSSLTAGASIACEPGFDPFRFVPRLTESGATWYTAVPTIHQTILARAKNGGALPQTRLRFMRSSSSAMPESVRCGIEKLFGVPLIEAYGMTECAHQIASNPLPPAERRPGSVGVFGSVEVAVADAKGKLLPLHARGEVIVRGPSVTSGYEAMERELYTFDGGWLRTGDQGYLDGDGYLFLTGRLKELVNRGGEKISPAEVEEVLLAHPAVAAAVVFAVPHPSLGEEVGGAVVVREDVTSAAIRAFAATRLAAFKVPRKLLIIDAIPLGPTGKPLRVGMAKRLGLA